MKTIEEMKASLLADGNCRPFTPAELARFSHSRHCCKGWAVKQPDGTETRSFKKAAEGSFLKLHYLYTPYDGCALCEEQWYTEYYLKLGDGWYSISECEFIDFKLEDLNPANIS